jgi:hypothetical protein
MGCPAWLSPALSMTLLKEETMLVHPVVIPASGTLSWTVWVPKTCAAWPDAPLAARPAPARARGMIFGLRA